MVNIVVRPLTPLVRERRRCSDCQQMQVAEYFATRTRCGSCEDERQHLYRLARRERKRALNPDAPWRGRWNEDELARLKEACDARMTWDEAVRHVGNGRTGASVAAKAWRMSWLGLRETAYTRDSPRTWTPEQIAALHAAVLEHGPRGAARVLGLSPGKVAGALSRYGPPSSA